MRDLWAVSSPFSRFLRILELVFIFVKKSNYISGEKLKEKRSSGGGGKGR